MRSFVIFALSLFTITVSAFDTDTFIATLKERQLAEGDSGDNCLSSALSSASTSLATASSLLMGSDVNDVCPDLSACDLGASDFATQLKEDCDNSNGKVFVESISLCKNTIKSIIDISSMFNSSEIEDLQLDSIEEIEITGIPICLSSTCPDDFDLFDTLVTLLPTLAALIDIDGIPTDVVKDITDIVTEVLEGKECSNKFTSTANPGRLTAFAGALVLGMTYSIL